MIRTNCTVSVYSRMCSTNPIFLESIQCFMFFVCVSLPFLSIYRISSNKRPSAYLKLCAKGWALIRGRALNRGALIKYFVLTNLIKHLFLTKTIVIQSVAIGQRLNEEIIYVQELCKHVDIEITNCD